MATQNEIYRAIDDVLQDPGYSETDIVAKINQALQRVAGGIRMPNGEVSPPLPDLYAYGTVNTSTTLPYVPLPTDYQRKVVRAYDSSNNVFSPPRGGDYYSFNLFLKQINNFNLAETGSIYRVAIKGSKIYYQGIPTASTTIGFHYYRKPATLALDGDIPEGIPEHLAENILKHYVLKEIFGEKIEDGQDNSGIATKYHTAKFYEFMIDLCDYIGIDGEPEYYGGGETEDAGACD